MEAPTLTIRDHVIAIIANELGVLASEISDSDRFYQELRCDNLDVLSIVMAVEDESNVDLTDDEVEKLATVGDLVALVADKAQHSTGDGASA